MSILKVARMGHPVLRRVAEPVSTDVLLSDDFQRFCDDLLETMIDQDGVGLAAPQVHHSVRVVVFQLDEEPMFLVNPVVMPRGAEKASGYEGCLSVPEMRGRVERWDTVEVEALDRTGAPLRFLAHGWAARVVQHECDHLDGVLYVDRADPRSLAFLSEFRRHGPLVPSDDDLEEGEGDEE